MINIVSRKLPKLKKNKLVVSKCSLFLAKAIATFQFIPPAKAGGNGIKFYLLLNFAFSLIISLIFRFSILLSSQEMMSR